LSDSRELIVISIARLKGFKCMRSGMRDGCGSVWNERLAVGERKGDGSGWFEFPLVGADNHLLPTLLNRALFWSSVETKPTMRLFVCSGYARYVRIEETEPLGVDEKQVAAGRAAVGPATDSRSRLKSSYAHCRKAGDTVVGEQRLERASWR
jgi:hypothetical protein